MAHSPLTVRVLSTAKRSSRNGRKVTRVNVHHWAGTRGGIERLVHSKDPASANYIILDDGTLISSVPEEYRAWTSGSAAADEPAVTIEVQNSSGGPEWRVSAAAIATLTRLIADVAKRHGWKAIGRAQVRGHREFAATACPGPYLYARLERIAADAEKIRAGGTKPKPSKPAKPKPSGKLDVDGYWGKDVTTRTQQVAGTSVDGKVSGQERQHRQPGLTSGWEWNAPGAGKGSQLIYRLQVLLKAKDLYKGKLDGIAGPKFWTAFQLALGTHPDGEIWAKSPAIKQFQRNLNEGKLW